MSFVEFSSDAQERFASLTEVYLGCRDAYREIMIEAGALAAPGSRAQLDAQVLLARKPPIAESSERLITELSQLYLYAATEHLGALGRLYENGEVLIAPHVLARCSVECSAHAIWILGDPKSEAEDRLARAFLEEIMGAEQAQMQSGRLTPRSGVEHNNRRDYYRFVKRDAEATFAAPHRDEHGRPMLRGQQMPSPEQIVVQMNLLTTNPLQEDAIRGVYGLLSNFVHPTAYALKELFTVREVNGQRVATVDQDIEFHDKLARFAIVPFYRALTFVTNYHGWASARHAHLSEEIARLLPGIFVGGSSPGPFDPLDEGSRETI